MKLVIETYHALPCSTKVFTINGKDGSTDDFGEGRDWDNGNAEPYACSDWHFEPYRRPPEGILTKYSITRDEYDQICDELADKLSVGGCGWCV